MGTRRWNVFVALKALGIIYASFPKQHNTKCLREELFKFCSFKYWKLLAFLLIKILGLFHKKILLIIIFLRNLFISSQSQAIFISHITAIKKWLQRFKTHFTFQTPQSHSWRGLFLHPIWKPSFGWTGD